MPELQAHMERRSDPRRIARIAILTGPYLNELITDYTVNVGGGGLFIETVKLLPVDTPLMAKFKLPNMERIITCKSRVAWVNDPYNSKKQSIPLGMGIQFIGLSMEDMHNIRIFIDKGELVGTW